MRRKFSKIHHILHFIAPYGASIGISPLLCADFNPHSPNMLSTKFGSNQFSGFGK